LKGDPRIGQALASVIQELEEVKERLAELVKALPSTEVAPAEAEDVALRDVLDCIVADRLEPALRDLRSLTGVGE
jgi:hypothetical protein